MRVPKAVMLLNLLTGKELKQFQSKLKHARKEKTLALCNWLLKNHDSAGEESFRERMHQFIFDSPYDPSRDYLLRNELRLISEAVKDFLTKIQIEKEANQNSSLGDILLLSALYERKAIDIFKLEFKDIYDQALSRNEPLTAWMINRLNQSIYARFLHEKEINVETAAQLNELQLTHLNNFYISAYQNFQFNKAYLKQLKFPFLANGLTTQSPPTDQADAQNQLAAYFELKAQCYLLPVEQRTDSLKSCLEIAKQEAGNVPFFEEEVKFCLSELAKTYCLLHDFQTAEAYFHQFFKLEMEPSDPYRLAVLADYIAKLLKQKRTKEALTWIKSHQDELKKIEKLNVRLKCLKAAAYAFSGDAENLYEILPDNFTEYSRPVKHFFRLHYAIHAWLTENESNAIREIDNLLNAIQKSEPPAFDVRPVARFMRRYFNWAAMPDSQPRVRNLEKLQADLEQYEQNAAPVYKSYLPLIWLKMEMEN